MNNLLQKKQSDFPNLIYEIYFILSWFWLTLSKLLCNKELAAEKGKEYNRNAF